MKKGQRDERAKVDHGLEVMKLHFHRILSIYGSGSLPCRREFSECGHEDPVVKVIREYGFDKGVQIVKKPG